MTWAYFQNQAAWDAYHNAACADNGIPRPGKLQSDQSVQIPNCWTDAWVNPIQFKAQGNVTTWIAHVPEADVTKYNLTNTVPDSAVVQNRNGTVTVTVGGRAYIAEPTTITWRKAKPATWTDPDTGKVYPVAA